MVFNNNCFKNIFFIFLVDNDKPIKNKKVNCDCCGEDLATAHTV